MTPALAAATIRFIIAKQMVRNAKAEGHGKLWRFTHGMTMRNLTHKKVLLSNDNAGVVPEADGRSDAWVCFWILLNKPTTSKDIIIREGKNVVLAHVSGLQGSMTSGGQIGQIVQQYNEVSGAISDLKGTAEIGATVASERVRSKVASGIYSQLNEAWRAGVWDTVIGTRQEFSFGLGEALLYGACAFIGPLENLTIQLRTWGDKRQFMSLMAEAERKGINTAAAYKYVYGLTENGFAWSYSTKTQMLAALR